MAWLFELFELNSSANYEQVCSIYEVKVKWSILSEQEQSFGDIWLGNWTPRDLRFCRATLFWAGKVLEDTLFESIALFVHYYFFSANIFPNRLYL